MSISVSQVLSALGGESVVQRRVDDAYDLISLVKEGLPMQAVKQLQDKLGFSNKMMSYLLTISESTYQRRIKSQSKLVNDEAEKAIGLSELYAKGHDLFGTDEKFRNWLESSNFALGGRKPVDLLDTAIGRQESIGILIRIEHGIFS
jgi:putative toxin-antitoxin system antitoxin component (TIGR02293 family)